MADLKYLIGVLGDAGVPVGGAGGLRFEQFSQGANLKEARSDAKALAHAWAHDSEDGKTEVAIAKADDSGHLQVVALANATEGKPRIDWQ